ncbi:hypothetical protein [Paraburkholderia megapolitana]|uniref:hypothetical protein n=1 Tax=Paraburkholderia megapolitana TaxID=420953 RepID=UPI0038B90CEB
MENTHPLPSWFVAGRKIVIVAYAIVCALCVASIFILMIVGALVYRDFSNYSLAGNPWESSSFPWYVIDSMRLMTVVAALAGAAVAFYALYGGIALVSLKIVPDANGLSAWRRLLVAIVAIVVGLALVAWLSRWNWHW